jgi:hypothetical protein
MLVRVSRLDSLLDDRATQVEWYSEEQRVLEMEEKRILLLLQDDQYFEGSW